MQRCRVDKYEYSLKLDQMKNLCEEENYDAAADIADTINWNKVKNVNALVKVGEVFEKAERYQESHDVLLMAYDLYKYSHLLNILILLYYQMN